MRVINKKLIKETGLITNEAEQTTRADNEENIDQPAEINKDNIEQNRSQDVSTDSRVPPTSTDSESLIDIESESHKELKQKWDRNLEKYKKLRLDQREYQKRVNRPINRDNLKNMNFIVGQHLEQNVKEDGISLWDLNAAYYSAAVTVLGQEGVLKEVKNAHAKVKPGGQIQLEQQTSSYRRRLAFVDLILKCKKEGKYTKHQRNIEQKLKRWYKKTTMENLTHVRTVLKERLGATAEKLRRRKVVREREIINKKFLMNPKAVYRKFKADKDIEIVNPPSKEDLQTFWNNIWGKEKQFNQEANWLPGLEKEYCMNVQPQKYEMTMEILNKIFNNAANNKAPGCDRIVMYWLKKLTSTHGYFLNILISLNRNEIQMPLWLSTTRTALLPKNSETNRPENYRPIALQNSTYKIYTSILNSFLEDHCGVNNILGIEQAAAKKGPWGCTDQLLINKAIMEEVKSKRRNLVCVWLDYKKAFDSVPHDWLIKALYLAKIPLETVIAIEALTKTWTTQTGLLAKNTTIEADSIDYQRGILQSDGLSVILFALSINPVSFLPRKMEGYELGETIKLIINHLLFVDDLKLYSRTLDQMKKLLDIITTFTNDIGMIFGEAKCAYICIVRGKKKCLGSSIQINGLTIQELKEGEQYKYLGQDESVGYHGPLNKERVLKEYKRRVRKIWSSEHYGNNKATAHNTLAVPVITPTIGILQWTKKEICDIDIATHKILSYTGNLHKRADINRLYVPRKQGGRGLTSVEDIYISRHIILAEHLNEKKSTNPFLEKVVEHEQDKIIRLGEEFKQELGLSTTKKASREAIKHKLKQKHLEAWKNKPMHGYIFRKVEADQEIDTQASHNWLSTGLSSHMEGYATALQEQEIPTKATIKRRTKEPNIESKYRLCKDQEETIFHDT